MPGLAPLAGVGTACRGWALRAGVELLAVSAKWKGMCKWTAVSEVFMRSAIYAMVLVLGLGTIDAAAQTKLPVPASAPRLKIEVSMFERSERALIERPAFRVNAQTAARSSRRSVPKIILGAAVGGTAGFFAGGYTGAWIEGDRCHCDDPGLKGAIIGSLSGATVGAILGGLYLF